VNIHGDARDGARDDRRRTILTTDDDARGDGGDATTIDRGRFDAVRRERRRDDETRRNDA